MLTFDNHNDMVTNKQMTPVSETINSSQKASKENRPTRLRKVPDNLKDYILHAIGENVVNCLNCENNNCLIFIT